MQKRKYPTRRHTATLTQLYNNPHRRLPQAFAHKPNKEKKGVATSLLRVDPQHDCLACLAPLVPRASRASRLSRLPATCASQARAPLSNVRLSATCAFLSQFSSSSSLTHRQTRALPHKYSTLLSPSATAPRPLLGALHPCPPIGMTRHPSPCRSSLRKQAHDEHLVGRSARAFWREISARPRRVSIRPSGSVTTWCLFDGECR